MLRASGRHTGRSADIRAVLDPDTPSLLEWGGQLLTFTDAAVGRDPTSMDQARANLMAVAGERAVIRGATCVGNFQMMNRILDATGVPITAARARLAKELGLPVPEHLRSP